jgi:hypothetical protein
MGSRFTTLKILWGQALKPVQSFYKQIIDYINLAIERWSDPKVLNTAKIVSKFLGEALGRLISIINISARLIITLDNALGLTDRMYQTLLFLYNLTKTIYNLLKQGIKQVVGFIYGQIQNIASLLQQVMSTLQTLLNNILKRLQLGVVALRGEILSLLKVLEMALTLTPLGGVVGSSSDFIKNAIKEFERVSEETKKWLEGITDLSDASNSSSPLKKIQKSTEAIEKNTRKDSQTMMNFYKAIDRAFETRENLGNLNNKFQNWGQSKSSAIGSKMGPRPVRNYVFNINGQKVVAPGPENMTDAEFKERVNNLFEAFKDLKPQQAY